VSSVGNTTALFLRSVFNHLADLPHSSDQQLQEAIDFVLAKIDLCLQKIERLQ